MEIYVVRQETHSRSKEDGEKTEQKEHKGDPATTMALHSTYSHFNPDFNLTSLHRSAFHTCAATLELYRRYPEEQNVKPKYPNDLNRTLTRLSPARVPEQNL